MWRLQQVRRAARERPGLLLLILLLTTVLSFGDLLEHVSSLAPLLASLPARVFHELHDLLAFAIVLYAAHAAALGIAGAALVWFVVLHVLYFFLEGARDVPESFRFVGVTGIALFAIEVISRRQQLSRRLEALYRAAALVTSTLDPRDLLQRIVTAVSDVLGYGIMVFMEVRGDRLVPIAWSGYPQAPPVLTIHQGIAGQVVRTGKPVYLQDVSLDPDFIATGVRPLSAIACPVAVDGQVAGVLNVESAGSLLTREDFDCISSLAAELTVALRHALRHEAAVDQATRDGLTGLVNHTEFQARLREEMGRARRHGRPMSLVMVDIDGFKTINDTYGHPVGDRVLREFARILRLAIRGEDIAARYGGEEFAIILPETPASGAARAAERIRQQLEREARIKVTDVEIAVTASFGVAVFPDHADSAEDLLHRADEALYEAKRRGKNAVWTWG